MTIGDILLACLVLGVGAAIQGSVGFGVNLFAAPVLVLINPDFVPAPVILASTVLNLLVMRREQGDHHWNAVRWPIVGALPGSVLGAAALGVLGSNRDHIALFFGGLILVAVAVSAVGLHPSPSYPALVGAGFASGFMGTAIGIGGPPIAMMFQTRSGNDIRGALARFFLLGSMLSLVVLGFFGRLHADDVRIGLYLLPGTVAGYVVSGSLAGRVDGARVRTAVLALSAASALLTVTLAVARMAGSEVLR